MRRFDVLEGISKCFRAAVVAVSPDDDLDLDALVGRPAALTLGPRLLHGVCLGAEQVQAEEEGVSTYELELGPAIALLEHRSRHRIFQHRSVPEIVQAVLAEWRISAAMSLDEKRYPRLEHRVQLGETDLAFVRRLLEEAGTAFIVPTDGAAPRGDSVVLSDSLHTGDVTLALTHVEHPVPGAATPIATRLRFGRRMRAGRVVVRDQHFRLRPDAKLKGEATTRGSERFERDLYHHGASVVAGQAERARQGGGSSPVDAKLTGDTPVADARGAYRPDAGALVDHARRELERERGRRREVSFETNCERLAPGQCIRIEGHPREELRAGALLVTELRTTGSLVREGTRIEARALFTDVPYRPLLETPKPRAYGVHAAVVTGPAGVELHSDELGRVLVQFAWDHDGNFDEQSSSWLRVSQAWAGRGHTFFTLPRVGDEVIVGYFAGDPDQPVIIGRLHNLAAPPPHRLPEAQTVSAWRGVSTPATGGYNEIKFDDMAGAESVAIQAERDMFTLVKNEDTVEVGLCRRTRVGTTDDVVVGERHSTTVSAGSGATSIVSTASKIVVTTGEATMILDGPNVTFEVPGDFAVRAGGTFSVTAAGALRVESSKGDVVVQGGPIVRINPRGAGESPSGPEGQIPFDFPDGEGMDDFNAALTDAAVHAWFDPKEPHYLDEATARGGKLDPTPRGAPDDELRAFKYAVAGRCIGLPEGVLLRRAGAMNVEAHGASEGRGSPGNGVFGGQAPYGTSEPQHQAMRKGFDYFEKHYGGGDNG